MIGGALLDLVGVPLLSGAVSMEGVGTAAVIAGSATVGSALSKINVPVGSVQYSFAKNVEDRAKEVSEKATYSPHTKHVGVKSYGSKMKLSDEEAQKVLDDAVQSGERKYGFKDGKIYEFQCDDAGNNPTWHGYEIKGNELVQKKGLNVLKQWRDEGKISRTEYNKMKKGK
ncbi:hypothetical protein [Lactovum odontotermitis]